MISNLFNPPIQLLLYTIPDDCFPIAVDSRYTVILKAKLSIQNIYCTFTYCSGKVFTAVLRV